MSLRSVSVGVDFSFTTFHIYHHFLYIKWMQEGNLRFLKIREYSGVYALKFWRIKNRICFLFDHEDTLGLRRLRIAYLLHAKEAFEKFHLLRK